MRSRASAVTLAALGAALAASGCSYSPNPALFPPHLHTLAVPVFGNRTTEPNLDQEVTQAVITRFVQNNRLRVVSESDADLVVQGAVVGYTNSVFGFNAREQAQEYQVAVTVSVRVKDRVKNREMWADDRLVRTSNYFVVAIPGQQVQDQVSARQDAIDKLGEAIINRTVEGW